MKNLLLASALMLSLFGISYGIAAAVNSSSVTAKACTDVNCN